MTKRALLIGLFMMSFLCLDAQGRYSFSFRGITIEQALMEMEDKADVSIVYNPREISSKRCITLTISNKTLVDAIRQLLGQDYRVQQKNSIYIVQYVPRPAEPETTVAEIVEPEIMVSEPAEPEAAVNEPVEAEAAVNEPIEAEPVVAELSETAPVVAAPAESEPAVAEFAEAETAVAEPVEAKKEEKKSSTSSHQPHRPVNRNSWNIYQPTTHRLMTSLSVGYGSINRVASATTIFDMRYAYFFHENWGVSAGAGINYFSKPVQQSEEQLLTAYFPVTFCMDYKLMERLRLIGSAGASIELPISGVYGMDNMGERYGESVLYGTIGDIGVAVPLARTNRLFYALAISAYGQCIFNASGNIKDELQHQGIIPWQVGLRLSLMMNFRK